MDTPTTPLTNKEIARTFQLLGHIMELHGENPFKIRSYHSAYRNLRALERPLSEVPAEELESIKGVGKAISSKITELLETGQMQTLEKYKTKTPQGIQEMLTVKGFGPKKVAAVWKGLGVETVGELLYAVNENRLVELKGFGQKTQDALKEKLEYFQQSRGKFHYAALADAADALLAQVRALLPDACVELCGPVRRKAITLQTIHLLIASDAPIAILFDELLTQIGTAPDGSIQATTALGVPVSIYQCAPSEFGSKLFRYTGSAAFLEAWLEHFPEGDFRGFSEEETVFAKAGLPAIPPELREHEWGLQMALDNRLPTLLTDADLRGVLHVHTTYSDGTHTLRDMAERARALGYDYLGLTDHSKSAFYASGLKPERVLEQMAEVDALNAELAPFRIFKGIESDILNDGRLDYEEDMLKRFDFIIASVHSNLGMDEAKATQRLITAIENPYTRILGHPTGRLLLSRKGYPIDHLKVIDACAANGVAIELNANPYRLDLDWTWIPVAVAKGVPIAINPDAHSMEGLKDTRYGVCAARKGGLEARHCLNALSLTDFEAWLARS